jgi:hypothetical protein
VTDRVQRPDHCECGAAAEWTDGVAYCEATGYWAGACPRARGVDVKGQAVSRDARAIGATDDEVIDALHEVCAALTRERDEAVRRTDDWQGTAAKEGWVGPKAFADCVDAVTARSLAAERERDDARSLSAAHEDAFKVAATQRDDARRAQAMCERRVAMLRRALQPFLRCVRPDGDSVWVAQVEALTNGDLLRLAEAWREAEVDAARALTATPKETP